MIIVNTMIKVVFPSSSNSLSSSISDYDKHSDMISKPFMSIFIVCMCGMSIIKVQSLQKSMQTQLLPLSKPTLGCLCITQALEPCADKSSWGRAIGL